MFVRLIVLASLMTLSACGSVNDSQPPPDNADMDMASGESNSPDTNQPGTGTVEENTDTENESAENQETTVDGVTTTASGLQFEVLREAEGESPGPASVVTVHYVGMFTDGTQFDSSYDRGAPSTFSLRSVIRGWTEGLQRMNVGSQYRFTIPPELGYGDRQNGDIPPNSTLVFEVELLEINS